MNPILVVVTFVMNLSFAYGEFQLPLDIKTALARSSIGESGGFFVEGIDGKVLDNYIKSNWRSIAANIECLPAVDPGEGHSLVLDKDTSPAAVSNFASACECLPPLEYIDFLDTFLDLYEQKKIQFGPVGRNLMGVERKHDFLSVNYEHPRVQAICRKAIQLIPPEEVDLLNCIEAISKGELADNYMLNRNDDDPGPETLPGIKLKRPWASLIKKFELRTGIKAPYDPQFDPRPSRHDRATVGAPSATARSHPGGSVVWLWLFSSVVILVIAFSLWKMRNRARAAL